MKQSYERAALAVFIGVLMLGMATTSKAQELDLRWTVSIGSKHIKPEQQFNEFNPGLGFEARLAPDRKFYAVGGMYYNSVYAPSMYGGMGWEGVTVAPGVQLGAELGLVTGYEAFILPVVAGTVRVADHVKVQVIPPTPVSPLTFGLQVVF